MAEMNSFDDRTPRFVESVEQLQALVTWIDEFTLAISSRCDNSFGGESYKVGLKALNIVLSKGGSYLGCLNPVDAEECSGLIRELQKEVSALLAGGLAGALNSSDEQERAYERCQRILKFAVPHFQGLGVRIRDETRSAGRTDTSGHEGSKDEPIAPPTGEETGKAAGDKTGSTTKDPKRRTAPGKAWESIIGGLTEHHKFDGESCQNLEPIGVNKFAEEYGVSPSRVSDFLKEKFGSWGKYMGYYCRDAATLTVAIQMIRGELPPTMLFNRVKDETVLEDREE